MTYSAKAQFEMTINQKYTARLTAEVVHSLIEVYTHFTHRPEPTYNSSQAVAPSLETEVLFLGGSNP